MGKHFVLNDEELGTFEGHCTSKPQSIDYSLPPPNQMLVYLEKGEDHIFAAYALRCAVAKVLNDKYNLGVFPSEVEVESRFAIYSSSDVIDVDQEYMVYTTNLSNFCEDDRLSFHLRQLISKDVILLFEEYFANPFSMDMAWSKSPTWNRVLVAGNLVKAMALVTIGKSVKVHINKSNSIVSGNGLALRPKDKDSHPNITFVKGHEI